MAPETEMRTNKNGSKEMEFIFFVDFFAFDPWGNDQI